MPPHSAIRPTTSRHRGSTRSSQLAAREWINPNRVGELLNSYRKHGLVEIDWGPADPEIHLEIYDGPRLFLDHVVRLSELQP